MHLINFWRRYYAWIILVLFDLAVFGVFLYAALYSGLDMHKALTLGATMTILISLITLAAIVCIVGLVSLCWLIKTLRVSGKSGVTKEKYVNYLREIQVLN